MRSRRASGTRPRARSRRHLLIIAFALGGTALGAQAPRERPAGTFEGHEGGAPAYTRDQLRRECPASIDSIARALVEDQRATPYRCTIDTLYTLPRADDQTWVGVQYTLLHPDSTSKVVEIVASALYAARSAQQPFRLQWIGAQFPELVRSIYPELVRRPDGSAFVGITYCINGTGGCWQEYLSRRRGRWFTITEAWRRQLPALPGGRVGKGEGVDLATLVGRYGFYADDDANCCPSRELLIHLVLRRDSLFLVRHELRAP